MITSFGGETKPSVTGDVISVQMDVCSLSDVVSLYHMIGYLTRNTTAGV